MTSPDTIEAQYLAATLDALQAGDGFGRTLDAIPVPVYLTDADGAITYWNRACISFAGREPELGKDRWCVSWQLYTTCGEPIHHEECPMALAIKEQRPVRDQIAIAARPDGSRVAFRPYPTPLFNETGGLSGAVNILIDVSAQQGPDLIEQAARCRRLACSTHDRAASAILGTMAEGYEKTSAALLAGVGA